MTPDEYVPPTYGTLEREALRLVEEITDQWRVPTTEDIDSIIDRVMPMTATALISIVQDDMHYWWRSPDEQVEDNPSPADVLRMVLAEDLREAMDQAIEEWTEAHPECPECGEHSITEDGRGTHYCRHCDTCNECFEFDGHDSKCPKLKICDQCYQTFATEFQEADGTYRSLYIYTDPEAPDEEPFQFCSQEHQDYWEADNVTPQDLARQFLKGD